MKIITVTITSVFSLLLLTNYGSVLQFIRPDRLKLSKQLSGYKSIVKATTIVVRGVSFMTGKNSMNTSSELTTIAAGELTSTTKLPVKGKEHPTDV